MNTGNPFGITWCKVFMYLFEQFEDAKKCTDYIIIYVLYNKFSSKENSFFYQGFLFLIYIVNMHIGL